MANELTYIGEVSDEGVLKIHGRKSFDSEIKTFFSGKKVKITMKQYRKSRSNKQNALMHAYFQEIADQTNMHYLKVKAAMKAQFLTVDLLDDDGVPITNPLTGEVLKEVRDTSDLDTLEASEFCENIRLFVMDFGIYLKSPGEQEELKFNL